MIKDCPKLRVAVHGSYFARNFGDTLLVKIMCDWLAETVGRSNVFLAVAGHEAEQIEIGYPVIDPGLRSSVTHLVYTGGGYFGEPRLPMRARYRWYRRNYDRHISWMRDFARARKAIFGIGVGPLSDPLFRAIVRRLFSKMSVIYARDAESLAFIRDYRFNAPNAHLGIDLAMSITPAPAPEQERFCIHATSMPDAVLKQVVELLQAKLAECRDPSVDLVFDSAQSASAARQYEQTAARLSLPITIRPYAGVDQLLQTIADCRTVFSSKLHVGIVATALGRRVISLPVHQKTARFYRDLSLGDFCLEASRQNATEIARLLEAEVLPSFNRAPVALRISEMRRALKAFVHDADGRTTIS